MGTRTVSFIKFIHLHKKVDKWVCSSGFDQNTQTTYIAKYKFQNFSHSLLIVLCTDALYVCDSTSSQHTKLEF